MTTIKTVLAGAWARVKDEPVMTLALVQAALALGIGYGLKMSPDQFALTVAFTSAFLGWIARSQVSPVGS